MIAVHGFSCTSTYRRACYRSMTWDDSSKGVLFALISVTLALPCRWDTTCVVGMDQDLLLRPWFNIMLIKQAHDQYRPMPVLKFPEWGQMVSFPGDQSSFPIDQHAIACIQRLCTSMRIQRFGRTVMSSASVQRQVVLFAV